VTEYRQLHVVCVQSSQQESKVEASQTVVSKQQSDKVPQKTKLSLFDDEDDDEDADLFALNSSNTSKTTKSTADTASKVSLSVMQCIPGCKP